MSEIYDLQVTHGGLGVFLETHVKAVRSAGQIQAASDKLYEELLDKYFSTAAFASVPEVAAFAAKQAKATGIAAELPRLQQEQHQAELNVQKAMASSATGEKLAAAIADAKSRHQAAMQRVQVVVDSIRAFREVLAKDEAGTRAAMLEHFRAVSTPQIHAQAEQLRQRLLAKLGPILDELCGLHHVAWSIARKSGVEHRLDKPLT